MKSTILSVCTILVLSAIPGCNSTNTDKASVDFSGSDCKSHLYMPSSVGPALYTMDQSEPYQGLQCVSWQHDDDGLFSIDLINFHGACGAQYVGDYKEGDAGELNLQVNNPGCKVAACGYCVYDWSFQLENVAVADLTINVREDSCPESGDTPTMETFEVAASDLETGEGISCTYKYMSLFENLACGTLHQPCNALESDDAANDPMCPIAESQCDDGYTCTQTNDMPIPICVAECSETADCPLNGLLTCDNGLCLLK
jgi:hypothetical protein